MRSGEVERRSDSTTASYLSTFSASFETLSVVLSPVSYDEKTCHSPRNDLPSASGSMVVDVVTQLAVIIAGSAVLLAQGRHDG